MESLSVDMDEVITDTEKKLREFYFRDFGIEFSKEQLNGKNLKEIVHPDHSSVFYSYLNSPGFFRDLEIMTDAAYVLKNLNENYDLFIVTAALEFPNSLKDKYDWIMEFLPFIHWKQICLCGSKSLVQTDIMIDDRTRNFSNFKGRKILYDAHHNSNEVNYERVYNWNDIALKLL